MEIDPRLAYAKEAHPWELGKCIPQEPLSPKYVVRTLLESKIKKIYEGLCSSGKILRPLAF
jgi:hypothetical protein